MNSKVPYPIMELDDVTIFDKGAIKKESEIIKARCTVPRNKVDFRNEEYSQPSKANKDEFFVEVIRSNRKRSTAPLPSPKVPDFSQSYAISYSEELIKNNCSVKIKSVDEKAPYKNLCDTIRTEKRSEPLSFTKYSKKFLLTFQRIQEPIDNLLENTQLLILIDHKSTIKILIISVFIWQFSVIADQCSQFIRDICEV